MTIKKLNFIGLGLTIFFFALGCINIGEIIILKPKYIFCMIVAVYILMLAALALEIAIQSEGILKLKLLYFAALCLLGSAVAATVILPLIVTWQDWRPYDNVMMMVNLGLVLLLFFLKEIVRDWKKRPPKPARLQKPTNRDSYFDGLPRVMSRKKRIDVFFD